MSDRLIFPLQNNVLKTSKYDEEVLGSAREIASLFTAYIHGRTTHLQHTNGVLQLCSPLQILLTRSIELSLAFRQLPVCVKGIL